MTSIGMTNTHNASVLCNKVPNVAANKCRVILQISPWWTSFVICHKTWDMDLVLVSLES